MTIVSVLPLSVVQMEQCLHPTLQHFTLTLATPDTDWQTSTPTPTDQANGILYGIYGGVVKNLNYTYVCIYSFQVMISMCFKAHDRVVDHCCVPG